MQPFTFFISYRRNDTAPIALLLKYEIEKRLQFVRVAIDIQAIAIGDHFPDRIKHLIDEAHVTIALIGRNWMPQRGEGIAVSPDNDWVVHELKYSESTSLAMDERYRYGLTRRVVLPLFADCERRFDQFEVPKEIYYLTNVHAEQIDFAAWPNAIGPLIDRIAIKLNIKTRPEKDKYPEPNLAKARTQPLADSELATILSYDDYAGWYIDNFGDTDAKYLAKTFKFRGFHQATAFMELVASYCQILNHHPEWRNVFNHVTVALTTWDARRKVTVYDLNLALYMNKAAETITKKHN